MFYKLDGALELELEELQNHHPCAVMKPTTTGTTSKTRKIQDPEFLEYQNLHPCLRRESMYTPPN